MQRGISVSLCAIFCAAITDIVTGSANLLPVENPSCLLPVLMPYGLQPVNCCPIVQGAQGCYLSARPSWLMEAISAAMPDLSFSPVSPALIASFSGEIAREIVVKPNDHAKAFLPCAPQITTQLRLTEPCPKKRPPSTRQEGSPLRRPPMIQRLRQNNRTGCSATQCWIPNSHHRQQALK